MKAYMQLNIIKIVETCLRSIGSKKFNKTAIRCYENIGFENKDKY